MKILIVDNYDKFAHNLLSVLEKLTKSEITVVKTDEADATIADIYDGIIFSPGPGMPSEYPLMSQILDRVRDRKPILGICLGHQLIGEYFGAKLIHCGDSFQGVKKSIKILDAGDELYKGVPDNFQAVLYNSWCVDRASVPPELKITAEYRDENGVSYVMGFSHALYRIKSVQFHPESASAPDGELIIKNWLDYALNNH